MARNIEIKARVADLAVLERQVALLADSGPQVIRQEDVFFLVPQGRLKLRLIAEKPAQLIFYRRPDQEGPKLSDYRVVESSQGEALSGLLAAALGERGRVIKTRRLYLIGRTRVHLDQVEGLGGFLELEVVLDHAETATEGEAEAARLMQALGISKADLVAEAYMDLIAQL